LNEKVDLGGERPLFQTRQASFPNFRSACLILVATALCGCGNRVRHELYLENLAAENRDLEDQLYEYDHEYRLLEQELQSLRRENERLQEEAADLSNADWQSNRRELRSTPNRLPGGTPPKRAGSSQDDSGARDNASDAKGSPSDTPSADNLPSPQSRDDGFRGEFDEDEFDLDSLSAPSIEPGEPIPPPNSGASLGGRSGGSGESLSLEMNLSRVEVPARLASDSTAVALSASSEFTDSNMEASVSGEQEIVDPRIVELRFHPSLSQSANFDQRSNDDGLYLVLQPLNSQGRMVPTPAKLSVVVLDPAREGDAARIGRWDFEQDEVEQKLQPLGSRQGIHLTLRWQDAEPTADRVIVFARYTFPNGRQVIGQKDIFVSVGNDFPTVWSPRNEGRVVTVGASEQSDNRATNVVRPASGATVAGEAPSP
jgi:hypothetical protein